MNVLSLFDGISCARVALDYAGIPVAKYYCCEIDKFAIQVSNKNYPDIVRLGSVVDFKKDMVKEPIDLLIGGSPCQDLSIAKKNRQGLAGNRSSLFYEYVRIRDEVKPKYFILENVASMKAEDRDTITKIMGCEPVMFNASLVSAQTRKRYFWTNIKFDLPDDKGIILRDILQPDAEVDKRMVNKDGKSYVLTATYNGAYEKNSVEKKQRTMVKQQMTVTPQTGRNPTLKLGYIKTDHQACRVYDDIGKMPALNAICNSMVKVGRIVGRRINDKGHRDDNNKNIPIKQRVEVRDDDKSNNLSTIGKDNVVVNLSSNMVKVGNVGLYDLPPVIRKLTPIECERLQSLPDDYTEGISNSQRYKCLGNAFNCRVIAHILTAMLQQPKRVKIKLRLKSNHAPTSPSVPSVL